MPSTATPLPSDRTLILASGSVTRLTVTRIFTVAFSYRDTRSRRVAYHRMTLRVKTLYSSAKTARDGKSVRPRSSKDSPRTRASKAYPVTVSSAPT